jgi:hypothetical protein
LIRLNFNQRPLSFVRTNGPEGEAMTRRNIELYVAAREGDADQVERLLSQGADPNATSPANRFGYWLMGRLTPLMAASCSPRSNAKVVALLLASGADVHRVSQGGVTALWYAAGGLGFSPRERRPRASAPASGCGIRPKRNGQEWPISRLRCCDRRRSESPQTTH